MEPEGLAARIALLFSPYLKQLCLEEAPQKTGETPPEGDPLPWLRSIWRILGPAIEEDPGLRTGLADYVSSGDADALAAFRFQLKKLLARRPELARTLYREIVEKRIPGLGLYTGDVSPLTLGEWEVAAATRLELVRGLREGMTPAEGARRYGLDLADVYRINNSFCEHGLAGIIPQATGPDWLEKMGKDDPILRRLAMIALFRSGTPATVIGGQFSATEDYVERIAARFAKDGVLGILTEEDLEAFRRLNPPDVRVCSYNLHGTHTGTPYRLRRIARQLADLDVALSAFQEVINGEGVPDTSGEVARWMSAITGFHYLSHFLYCHPYMGKYPEGVAVAARFPAASVKRIDLTQGLPSGRKPVLDRYALAADVRPFNGRMLFVSVHLDHGNKEGIRLAQAEKLVAEVEALAQGQPVVLAGDFNDVETSPAMKHLASRGFRDAYRTRHRSGGETFLSSNPHARIDYILVRGSVEVLHADVILRDPDLSDHLGVFAVLRQV